VQTVLIVDDDPSACATLEALLQPMGLDLPVANSGPEAISMCRNLQPDLVLLDVMMPDMDGFEVCRQLRALPETSGIPIVMVTALQDRDSRLRGVEAGADDFLTKPIDRLELRARVQTTLRLNRYRKQLDQKKQLMETMEGTLAIMRDLLSLVDPESFGRAKRLKEMAEDLGKALDYQPLWELTIAASLCQLARVTLPDEIRDKQAGGKRLSGVEENMVTRVPETGARLLRHVPILQGVAKIVHWQDKRFDGTGFPFGNLAGTDIPQGARILRLLQDILQAESRGLSRPAAISHCAQNPGHHDPEILALAKEVLCNFETIELLVSLAELKPGMITRSDIKDNSGRLLVGPGIQITEALKGRLAYFHEIRGVQQPFEVTETTENP